jgi:hypothetical protein
MTVNTNSFTNIGQYIVYITASYVSLSGTIDLPYTEWVLNVKECTPIFTRITQPETPVDYTIETVSTTFTTLAAIKLTDSIGCGITPAYVC